MAEVKISIDETISNGTKKITELNDTVSVKLEESLRLCKERKENVDRLEEAIKTVETSFKRKELEDAKEDLQDFYEMTYNGIIATREEIKEQRNLLTKILAKEPERTRFIRDYYQKRIAEANIKGKSDDVKRLVDEQDANIKKLKAKFDAIREQLTQLAEIEADLRDVEYRLPYRPEMDISKGGKSNGQSKPEPQPEPKPQPQPQPQPDSDKPNPNKPNKKKPAPKKTDSKGSEQRNNPAPEPEPEPEPEQKSKKNKKGPSHTDKDGKKHTIRGYKAKTYSLSFNLDDKNLDSSVSDIDNLTKRQALKNAIAAHYKPKSTTEDISKTLKDVNDRIDEIGQAVKKLANDRLQIQMQKDNLKTQLENATDSKTRQGLQNQIAALVKQQTALTMGIRKKYIELGKIITEKLGVKTTLWSREVTVKGSSTPKPPKPQPGPKPQPEEPIEFMRFTRKPGELIDFGQLEELLGRKIDPNDFFDHFKVDKEIDKDGTTYYILRARTREIFDRYTQEIAKNQKKGNEGR